jgi:hypothetical protein
MLFQSAALRRLLGQLYLKRPYASSCRKPSNLKPTGAQRGVRLYLSESDTREVLRSVTRRKKKSAQRKTEIQVKQNFGSKI